MLKHSFRVFDIRKIVGRVKFGTNIKGNHLDCRKNDKTCQMGYCRKKKQNRRQQTGVERNASRLTYYDAKFVTSRVSCRELWRSKFLNLFHVSKESAQGDGLAAYQSNFEVNDMQASCELYSNRCQLLFGWAEQLDHTQQKFRNVDVTKDNNNGDILPPKRWNSRPPKKWWSPCLLRKLHSMTDNLAATPVNKVNNITSWWNGRNRYGEIMRN